MYNLFCRYVYVLELTDALLPRIALPCNETRDVAGAVAVRERTVRAVLFAATRDTVFVVPRDTTLRDVVPRDTVFAVPRDTDALGRPVAVVVRAVVVVGAAVVRTAVVRDVTPRATVAFDGFAVVVPRVTILDDVDRDDAGRADARTFPDVRADETIGVADTVATGAIGSANTARMDNNVEQTKNAPASKNTVPIAFLTCSAKLRLFINALLYSGNARKPNV